MKFWIIFFLVTSFLALSVFRRHPNAIAAVWCMYGLEQWSQASNPFFLQHGAFVNIFVGSLILMAVVLKSIKGGILRDYPGIGWIIWVLFFYSLLSVQWSPRVDLSYGIWGKYWAYCITFLILTPLALTDKKDFSSIFTVFFMVGSVLVVMLAFNVEWFHRRIVLTGGHGGFRHYNNEQLGNPLAIAQLGGYVFFVSMLAKSNTNKVLLLVRYAIAAACLILIVRSGSRGQLIGVVLTLLISWPIANKIANFKGIASLSIIGIVISVAIGWALDEFWKGSNRWGDNAMEESMSGRFDNAFVLLQHWQESAFSILFGLGNSASYDPKILGIYPHFLPLEILGEEGMLGFFIYLIILFLVVKIVLKTFRSVREDASARTDFAILFSMVFYSMLLSFKQGSLLGNMEFFMAAIMLGKFQRVVAR